MKYAIVSLIVLLMGSGCITSVKEGPEQNSTPSTVSVIMNPNISSSTAIVAIRDFPTDAGYAFRYGNVPAIVVRVGDGYIAYLDESPRPGCALSLNEGVLKSPCTGSRFDPATGAVLVGPAKEPLKTVDIYVKEEAIYLVNPRVP